MALLTATSPDGIGLVAHVAPEIRRGLQTLGNFIGGGCAVVAEDFEPFVVVVGEQGQGEQRLAVLPEIRRDIADAQPAAGIAAVGMRLNGVLRWLGMLLIPAAMLLGDSRGINAGMIVHGQDEIAGGIEMAGL